jgi:hypothetical protein
MVDEPSITAAQLLGHYAKVVTQPSELCVVTPAFGLQRRKGHGEHRSQLW